jgi:hypothetical protein
MKNEAFVYCWTDHKTNKLYVGSHKGSTNDGYICSSKLMLEEYKKRPEDFTRQIIAQGSFTDIRNLESAILKSINVKLDEQFYNQHNSDGKFYLKGHTQKSKDAIGKAHKGKKSPFLIERNKLGLSEETRKKISENHHDVSGKNNPMFGKKHTEKARKAMSEKRKGINTYIKTDEVKKKMSEAKKLYWAKRKGLI